MSYQYLSGIATTDKSMSGLITISDGSTEISDGTVTTTNIIATNITTTSLTTSNFNYAGNLGIIDLIVSGTSSFIGTSTFSVIPICQITASSLYELCNYQTVGAFFTNFLLQAHTWTLLQTFNVLPQSTATPSANTDLTTKTYVDSTITTLKGATNTWSLVQTFNALPQSTATPSANNDLTTKTFVDSTASSAASSAITTLKGATNTWSGTNNFSGLCSFTAGGNFTLVVPTSTIAGTTANHLMNFTSVDTAITNRLTTATTINFKQTIATSGATPALTITNTEAISRGFNFLCNGGQGSYNGVVQAGDSVLYAAAALNGAALTLTTWGSPVTCGIRISSTDVTVSATTSTISGTTTNFNATTNNINGTTHNITGTTTNLGATTNNINGTNTFISSTGALGITSPTTNIGGTNTNITSSGALGITCPTTNIGGTNVNITSTNSYFTNLPSTASVLATATLATQFITKGMTDILYGAKSIANTWTATQTMNAPITLGYTVTPTFTASQIGYVSIPTGVSLNCPNINTVYNVNSVTLPIGVWMVIGYLTAYSPVNNTRTQFSLSWNQISHDLTNRVERWANAASLTATSLQTTAVFQISSPQVIWLQASSNLAQTANPTYYAQYTIVRLA